MKNLLVALVRSALFLVAWVLATVLCQRLMVYAPALASLSGAQGALRNQLCALVPALLLSWVFGFIDTDAHGNGTLALGRLRGGTVGFLVGFTLILPVIILVFSGACSIEPATIMPDSGVATGLGLSVPLGAAEGPGVAAVSEPLKGLAWWIVYLAAVAATETIISFGYVFSVLQARSGDVSAVIVSTLVFLGVTYQSIPLSATGAAVCVAIAILLSLVGLESGGLLAPFATRFFYLLVARMGFGVALTSAACPSLFPLSTRGEGFLFGVVTVPGNIQLVLLLFTALAVLFCAIRAWRTRP
ncbi:MAG: hypothetical protein SOV74_02575 [Coriobacteriales bacterium]|nr:hypothetical protein [Coriobacteriales bacterium]